MAEPKSRDDAADPAPGQDAEAGELAQEWGGRVETGKQIARGGKESGRVPGAEDEDDRKK